MAETLRERKAQEVARLRAAQTPEEREPILRSMQVTGLLQGANLYEANLQGAGLGRANLQGVRTLSVEQLRQAESLLWSTLPDGTELQRYDTWREAFEAWSETVETDERGRIKPAELPDADPDADD